MALNGDGRLRRRLSSGLLLALSLSVLPRPLVLEACVTLPHGAQPAVPNSEKGLAKVGLDAPALVVNIMVGGIVAGNVLQGIPGQRVSAVVIDRLHGAKRIEEDGHARRHAANLVGQARTCRV